MSLKDTSRRYTTPDEPELVAAHDVLFVQMKTDAEQLVRQIKDLAYDEAVLQLLTKILEVRRDVQDEVTADIARRFDHITDAVLKDEPS